MMFGRVPVLPFDRQEDHIILSYHSDHVKKLNQFLVKLNEQAKINIIKNQERYIQRYDLNRSDPSYNYNINDSVRVKTLNIRYKFDIRYEGLFRIIKIITSKIFIIQHVKNQLYIVKLQPARYFQFSNEFINLRTSLIKRFILLLNMSNFK